MFEFPDISPVALDFGIIKIRWYALSYIAGIVMSWYLILRIIKLKKIDINTKQVSDLVGNAMIGIIIGGRLGYVLFYNPCLLYTSPSPRDALTSRMPSSA